MKFRHEYKHRINSLDLMLLRKRLEAVMERDSFALEDGSYYIKSLYFDNYTDKALREKVDGVNRREKFRIRYYNNDTSFIRLEKKSKINNFCLKESTAITLKQCQQIIDGDIDFLIKSNQPLFNELYAKMQYQLLRPKCIVAYDRESFVCRQGNTRVTLDTDIRGSYDVKSFLSPDTSMTQLYHTSILEVKWDEYLPEIVNDAVRLKSRRTSSFSKYAAVRF